MKGKKLMSVLLCTAMAVGISSCGNKQTANEGETPTLIWYVPGEKQADMSTVMEAANAIIEPAIGAKLDLRFIDQGSYTEKMNMSMSSQEVFDLCFTGFVNPFDTTAKKGGYLSMNELLETTPDLWASIPEWLWEAGKINGEIYAMPNYQVVSNWQIPFVYTDLIEECDLDLSAVKTADDLEILLEKIHEKHPEKYPWRVANGPMLWGQDKESVAAGVYVETDDETLTAKTDIESESGLHTSQIIREWFKKGYIRSDSASVTDDNLDYVNGKYAIFQSTYKPSVEPELESRLGADVTPIFIGEAYVTRASCTATMTAISRTSPNPDKAIKLIELMNTNKELYNIICYGIEGKHYTWLDDNHIKLDPASGYYLNASWKFGNQFNAYLIEGMADDVWERTIEMNNNAKKSPLLGFVFDPSAVSSEIAQVTAVSSEYAALYNGSREIDEFYDDYISRMKAAGIEKIREEAQRQLDEYKKTLK